MSTPWTDAELDSLRSMRARGIPIKAIAFTLGRGQATVIQKIRMDRIQTTVSERRCICCGHPFKSAGCMNRMCPTCRHRDVSPFEPSPI